MTNPFVSIVNRVSDEPVLVDIPLLNWIIGLFKEEKMILPRYEDAVSILEYLHEHGAVELIHNTDNTLLLKKREYTNG